MGAGMGSFVDLAGAASGAGLAKLMGGDSSSGSSGPNIQAGINQMNKTLTNGLNQALGYNSNYTGQAQGSINTGLNSATSALNTGLSGATSAVNTALNGGLQQYQSAQAPYANAGYGALDAYQDSLGLSRPTQGSQSVAQSLNQFNQLQPALQNLQAQAKTAGVSNPYSSTNAAPTFNQTAPQLSQFTSQITPDQENQWVQQNIKQGKGGWSTLTDPLNGQKTILGNSSFNPQRITQPGYDGGILNQLQPIAQQVLANQQYQSAMGQYNTANQQYQTNLGNYNNYNQAYQQVQGQLNGMNPQAVQTALAYNQGQLGTI